MTFEKSQHRRDATSSCIREVEPLGAALSSPLTRPDLLARSVVALSVSRLLFIFPTKE